MDTDETQIMTELFTIPECKSPRLKWLEKYCVHIHHNPDVQPGDECEVTGEPIYPFCAYVGPNTFPKPYGLMGCGNTEDEAIANLAKARGWKLWNETSVFHLCPSVAEKNRG